MAIPLVDHSHCQIGPQTVSRKSSKVWKNFLTGNIDKERMGSCLREVARELIILIRRFILNFASIAGEKA